MVNPTIKGMKPDFVRMRLLRRLIAGDMAYIIEPNVIMMATEPGKASPWFPQEIDVWVKSRIETNRTLYIPMAEFEKTRLTFKGWRENEDFLNPSRLDYLIERSNLVQVDATGYQYEPDPLLKTKAKPFFRIPRKNTNVLDMDEQLFKSLHTYDLPFFQIPIDVWRTLYAELFTLLEKEDRRRVFRVKQSTPEWLTWSCQNRGIDARSDIAMEGVIVDRRIPDHTIDIPEKLVLLIRIVTSMAAVDSVTFFPVGDILYVQFEYEGDVVAKAKSVKRHGK